MTATQFEELAEFIEALKEGAATSSRDFGRGYAAAAKDILQVVREWQPKESVQTRADALTEAADEIHREARWQTEQKVRTATISDIRATIQFDYSIERLGCVEQILRDRAAGCEQS